MYKSQHGHVTEIGLSQEKTMAALGGTQQSFDELFDEYLDLAYDERIVMNTLRRGRAEHRPGSIEHNAHRVAIAQHGRRELGFLMDAGWMMVGILCTDAGFPPGLRSTHEIEKAQERWFAELKKAA